MYNVYAITANKTKKMVMYNNQPAFFETASDAWDFVQQMMSQKDHPRLMWIKEVIQSESSQP